MHKPQITILSQVRLDKTITITGYVTGNPTSTSINLPAAAVPNGAVSRPAGTLTLSARGYFSYAFTACPYGDYGPGTVSATNADGTSTATTWPMTLYVPGTQPVGLPRAILPPYSVPAFTAATVPLGVAVTDIVLESRSGTDQTNLPFTFGQPFPAGDMAPGDFLVGKIAGQADVPLQFNVKATHADGSVRHAIISGILPSLATGTSVTMQLVRTASGTSTTPTTAASIATAGVTARIDISIAGVAYTADATAALKGTLPPSALWLGGAIVNDYILNLPFKDANGVAHPDLTAQFSIRHYPGVNKARVDACIEHTKAYTAIFDVTYTGNVFVGGQSVFPLLDAGGVSLTHFPATRWHRVFWWKQANPVHIRHNRGYLVGSRQLPNYDLRVTPSQSALADYPVLMQDPSFSPMGEGLFVKGFGMTGGRPDIGLAPSWYAMYVISQDPRAKDMMLALAGCGGSWHIHRRDTSNGPASGHPIDSVHYARITMLGTGPDSKNTATGQQERLPNHQSTTTMAPDNSHQPSFAYIPYVVTGDYYYLDELLFWNSYNLCQQNPGLSYRAAEKGLTWNSQVRGQAWNLRTMAQCAAIAPDTHPQKPAFIYQIENNFRWYNDMYPDNPDANKLGIWSHGNAIVYNQVNEDDALAAWMQDFAAQAMGHAGELGFTEAVRHLRWMAKFQVGRMIDPGYCWTYVPYSFRVRIDATSPIFTSLGECLQAMIPAEEYAMRCNSPERLAAYKANGGEAGVRLDEMQGRDSSSVGYPANMQPGLAMAVDSGSVPDSDLAWDLFDSRPYKPTYASQPQFAIVSRGYVPFVDNEAPPPPVTLPDDVYLGLTNQTLYFGKAAP